MFFDTESNKIYEKVKPYQIDVFNSYIDLEKSFVIKNGCRIPYLEYDNRALSNNKYEVGLFHRDLKKIISGSTHKLHDDDPEFFFILIR